MLETIFKICVLKLSYPTEGNQLKPSRFNTPSSRTLVCQRAILSETKGPLSCASQNTYKTRGGVVGNIGPVDRL